MILQAGRPWQSHCTALNSGCGHSAGIFNVDVIKLGTVNRSPATELPGGGPVIILIPSNRISGLIGQCICIDIIICMGHCYAITESAADDIPVIPQFIGHGRFS
jgi:hypothetical protein